LSQAVYNHWTGLVDWTRLSGLDWWTHRDCHKNTFFSVDQKLIQYITLLKLLP